MELHIKEARIALRDYKSGVDYKIEQLAEIDLTGRRAKVLMVKVYVKEVKAVGNTYLGAGRKRPYLLFLSDPLKPFIEHTAHVDRFKMKGQDSELQMQLSDSQCQISWSCVVLWEVSAELTLRVCLAVSV